MHYSGQKTRSPLEIGIDFALFSYKTFKKRNGGGKKWKQY